jgi:hypothetical protein
MTRLAAVTSYSVFFFFNTDVNNPFLMKFLVVAFDQLTFIPAPFPLQKYKNKPEVARDH